MTKILIILIIILLGYFAYQNTQKSVPIETQTENENSLYTTYSSSELGLEFDYRARQDGYILEEIKPTDTDIDLKRTFILFQTEDKQKEIPEGGEGPAVISISVFNNSKKESSINWADKNIQYSNINLKTTDVSETVIGGANAIQYMTDGLYASEVIVVAYEDNIYGISGHFLDIDFELRYDFAPLIESIRFIPDQEQKQV